VRAGDLSLLGKDLDAFALAKAGGLATSAGKRTARFLPHRPIVACDMLLLRKGYA